MLAGLGGAASLERVWLRAALSAIASGCLVDPPIAELKELTTPERAFQGVSPWPTEALGDRIGRLVDSHRLAIAIGDLGWLAQLDASWEAAPPLVDALRKLRAQGEIRLGRSPGGSGALGWTPDELEALEEESFLRPDAPADRAWRALSMRDRSTALRAIADYQARMTDVARRWEVAAEEGLRQIALYPAAALQIEVRALLRLVERIDTRDA